MPTKLSKRVTYVDPAGGLVHSFGDLRELRSWVKQISIPGHDGTDHSYEESKEWPGTCAKCSWIHPGTMAPAGCGHTLIEHALSAFDYIEYAISIAEKKPDDDELQLQLQGIFYRVAGLLGLDTDQPKDLIQRIERSEEEALADAIGKAMDLVMILLHMRRGHGGGFSIN